jgi:hypothetical protein
MSTKERQTMLFQYYAPSHAKGSAINWLGQRHGGLRGSTAPGQTAWQEERRMPCHILRIAFFDMALGLDVL